MTSIARLRRQDQREIERLSRLLEAERQRADKAWVAYKETLYENVTLKMTIDEIRDTLAQLADAGK